MVKWGGYVKRSIRVLVVDDSALCREQICDVIEEATDLEVAGTARDGMEALEKIKKLQPDIVTLDVQMPRMDGLQTLDAILSQRPIPVVMVSALTMRAADVTFQSLERGALDYITKPDSLKALGNSFRDEMLHKLRTMAGADVQRVLKVRQAKAQRVLKPNPAAPAQGVALESQQRTYDDCCIAIGISTGGPPALASLFPALHPPLPAIVVVQHMPANFTGPFARRLDSISQLSVKEAESGDVLQPNHVYVAPGGRHLRLRRVGSRVSIKIFDGEQVSGHRPSVDVMMGDAAQAYGDRCLGVIMTGMGHDGSDGCGAIRAAGGYVLGQDETTSDVYGMNKVAFTSGNVDRQFKLPELSQLIPHQCRKLFRLEPAGMTSNR